MANSFLWQEMYRMPPVLDMYSHVWWPVCGAVLMGIGLYLWDPLVRVTGARGGSMVEAHSHAPLQDRGLAWWAAWSMPAWMRHGIAATLGALLAAQFLSPTGALAGAILAVAIGEKIVQAGRDKTATKAALSYREGLNRLAALVEAGYTVESALPEVQKTGELWQKLTRLTATGMSLTDAVAVLGAEVPEGMQGLATILPVLQQSGARVAPLLTRYGDMEERMSRLRDRQYALAAQGRWQARVLSLLPLFLLPILMGMDPGMAAFYSGSWAGGILLTAAALVVAGANFWMERRLAH